MFVQHEIAILSTLPVYDGLSFSATIGSGHTATYP